MKYFDNWFLNTFQSVFSNPKIALITTKIYIASVALIAYAIFLAGGGLVGMLATFGVAGLFLTLAFSLI